LASDVVEVVGDDQRQPELGAEPEELPVEPALLREPMILELEEEPVLAQDLGVLAGHAAGEVPVLDLERARDLAIQAGRQADQAEAVEALRARLVDEVGDASEAVEEAELGVGVEVDEVVGGERQAGTSSWRSNGAGSARSTRSSGARPVYRGLSCEGERQRVEASRHDIPGQPDRLDLRRSLEAPIRSRGEQLLEERARLDPGEVDADAGVGPVAERQVGVRATIEPDLVGMVEDRHVMVRGTPTE